MNVDLLKIHCNMKLDKELMRFACSMSQLIDPRRSWKLTPQQPASVKYLPWIVKLARRGHSLGGSRRQPERGEVLGSSSTP
jgi:hypothetical protein